jgi:hypothetical protein
VQLLVWRFLLLSRQGLALLLIPNCGAIFLAANAAKCLELCHPTAPTLPWNSSEAGVDAITIAIICFFRFKDNWCHTGCSVDSVRFRGIGVGSRPVPQNSPAGFPESLKGYPNKNEQFANTAANFVNGASGRLGALGDGTFFRQSGFGVRRHLSAGAWPLRRDVDGPGRCLASAVECRGRHLT